MIFRTAAARQLQGNFASRMRRVVAGRFATFAFRGAQVTAVGFATGCTLTAATVFCEAHQSSKSKQVQPFDVDAIREDIEKLIAADLTNGPLLVRLAWHEAASWHKTKKDGAPNTASMRFAPECKYGGNAGLDKARNLLEPIKKRHPSISYADLWVLAANVAISSMGGPEIPFRYGRVDAKDGSVCAEARLPDAAQTQQHVRDTFLGRLGFTDRETVALIGAHTIGECHADRSGFVGPWTHDRFGFDSSFFSELLENDWILDTRYPQLQFTDSKTRRLMMLPSDVALLLDKEYLKFVKLYAEDQDLWWADFAKAFQKLLELGNHNLKELPSRK